MDAIDKFLLKAEETYSQKAWAFYSTQTERLGARTTKEIETRIEILTKRSCWLLGIAEAKHSTYSRFGFINKTELMQAALTVFKRHNLKPQTLPSLNKILANFRINSGNSIEKAFDSLISRKVGNSNAMKKITNEQRGLIMDLYNDHGGKLKTILRFYNNEANRRIEVGIWKKDSLISISTLRSVVREYQNV